MGVQVATSESMHPVLTERSKVDSLWCMYAWFLAAKSARDQARGLPVDVVWRSQCHYCSKPFHALRRKTHCLTCREVFCSDCIGQWRHARRETEKVCLACILEHIKAAHTRQSRRPPVDKYMPCVIIEESDEDEDKPPQPMLVLNPRQLSEIEAKWALIRQADEPSPLRTVGLANS
ncbi:hypothetical protein LEN26_001950 [Aphanomyces euteiches]|nr:hypothetical protein AeNC1_019542 [Aphanomyces euteiches]KAH9160256.1 hypothetical protein LEN26_001950 [Aphanomyces euteiches]